MITHTLPDSVTLADLHLIGVKPGDEITTISRADNGGLSVASCVSLVDRVEDWRVTVQNKDGKTRGSWLVKNGGGCPYAMHDQNVMRFYYSANPEHITKAKRQIKAEREQEQARKLAFEAQMIIARPIGEALGDGWQSGSNGGDDFLSQSAAHALAEKLTPDQMRTLAGWLGVDVG